MNIVIKIELFTSEKYRSSFYHINENQSTGPSSVAVNHSEVPALKSHG